MAKGYHYDPSIAAAGVFLGLFAISLAIHAYQVFTKKSWFMMVLVTATTMEVIGYVSRIIAANEEKTRTPRIISETMLVSAPAFFSAQDYMIIGRMIAYAGGNLAIIRDTWITKIFVSADLLTILTQVVGIVILTGADSVDGVKKAKNILLVGLSLQVVTFSVFLIVAVLFDIKSHKQVGPAMQTLRPLFTAIYVTGVLIIGRSIYRTAEFASISFEKGEQSGYLITHEWPFYVFDSIPIIISTFMINYIHPGNFLPTRKGELLDRTQFPSAGGSWFRLHRKKDKVVSSSRASEA